MLNLDLEAGGNVRTWDTFSLSSQVSQILQKDMKFDIKLLFNVLFLDGMLERGLLSLSVDTPPLFSSKATLQFEMSVCPTFINV